jgi:hypothetical protein
MQQTPGMHVRRTVVGLVATGAVLAGCGQSSHTYFRLPGERTFFEHPRDWSVINVDDEPATDRPKSIDLNGGTRAWVIDASPNPDRENLLIPIPDTPVGVFSAIDASRRSGELHDAVNVALLRTIAAGSEIDPLSDEALSSGDFEIIEYDESVVNNMSAMTIVFNWQREPGRWVTIAQRTFLDAGPTVLYRLAVKCESSCFEEQRTEIDRLLASFKVRA